MPEAGGKADSTPLPAHVLSYSSRKVRLRIPIDRVLVCLLLVSLSVRVVFSLSRPTDSAALAALPDQIEYLELGESMAALTGMRLSDATVGWPVRAYRMPAYPWLVMVCGSNVTVVRTVQALIDTSSVLAVYLIGLRHGGQAVARLAGLAVGLNPFLIYFSSLVLSECFFTALLIWGVYLLVNTARPWQKYGLLVLTLAVYVRPSAIGLGITMALGLSGLVQVGFGLGRRVICYSVVAAALLVVSLLPWAARNRLEIGRWVWTTTNSGYTAYDSFNPSADGSSNQAVFKFSEGTALLPTILGQADDRFVLVGPDGEVERSTFLTKLAWEYAKTNPGRVVSLAFAKLGRFWAPWPLSADFGGKWYYVTVGAVYTVPLFVFAALGVWRGRMPWRVKLILLLPALYFSAVHSVFVGSLRYRVPCDVPLAVLAAAGVVSFVKPKGEAV